MELLEKYFDIALETPDGVKKLRELIFTLAMQGKLVPQDEQDSDSKNLILEINKKREGSDYKTDKHKLNIDHNKLPFKIPLSWTWCLLSDIGETNIGLTYSPNDISVDGTVVLRSSNVQKGIIDLQDLVRVNKKIKESLYVKKNDILICARNGSKALVGKAALITDLKERMTFGAFMAIYRSPYNEYVYQFLQSPIFRKSLENVSTTTINQITQNDLKNTFIPLPPWKEQKRIVEKIAELMSLCDQLESQRDSKIHLLSKVNNSAINKIIKAEDDGSFEESIRFVNDRFNELYSTESTVDGLRRAILNLGISGKFAVDSINFTPTKKFTAISIKEEPFILPENWIWTKLDNLGETQTGTTPPKKNPEYYGDYIPFLGPGDIKDFKINYANEGLSKLGIEKARFIAKNSILMVCIGGSIGKMAINDRDVTCNQQINTITPFEGVHLNYLSAVLQSDYFKNKILLSAGGSATPIINKGKWISIPIPLPPFDIQIEISNKIEKLLNLCATLEDSISQVSNKQSQILNSVLANI